MDYVTAEIKVLEPKLLFTKLGVQRDIPKGWNKLNFPQWNQLATSSVSTLSEGTNPTVTTWGNTAYNVGITQYGIVVQTTDVLVRNSAIEVVDNAIEQVRNAMLRQIDNSLQTTVTGGTFGALYAGGKSTRTALAAGDILDTTTYLKGIRNLRHVNSAGLMPFDGNYFVAVAHPDQVFDFMTNSGQGTYQDIGRYTSVDNLLKGTVGDFRGARVMESANVQTFSSTVTVYPMSIIGKNSFGWGYFQPLTPELVTSADSNNILNLYTSIGAKVGIGSIRFEDTTNTYRIVRIESAVSS